MRQRSFWYGYAASGDRLRLNRIVLTSSDIVSVLNAFAQRSNGIVPLSNQIIAVQNPIVLV